MRVTDRLEAFDLAVFDRSLERVPEHELDLARIGPRAVVDAHLPVRAKDVVRAGADPDVEDVGADLTFVVPGHGGAGEDGAVPDEFEVGLLPRRPHRPSLDLDISGGAAGTLHFVHLECVRPDGEILVAAESGAVEPGVADHGDRATRLVVVGVVSGDPSGVG